MIRDPRFRLQDILHRIDSIAAAEAVMVDARRSGREAIADVARNAILYDLVVIGEAVRALPDSLLDTEPDVPWRLVVGMRNRLAHEYFRLRPEQVALTIDEPLRRLHEACTRMLAR